MVLGTVYIAGTPELELDHGSRARLLPLQDSFSATPAPCRAYGIWRCQMRTRPARSIVANGAAQRQARRGSTSRGEAGALFSVAKVDKGRIALASCQGRNS